MVFSHLKEKQTHLQTPEVGGGGLGKGLWRGSVLSLRSSVGRQGSKPHSPSSTLAGLSSRKLCLLDG